MLQGEVARAYGQPAAPTAEPKASWLAGWWAKLAVAGCSAAALVVLGVILWPASRQTKPLELASLPADRQEGDKYRLAAPVVSAPQPASAAREYEARSGGLSSMKPQSSATLGIDPAATPTQPQPPPLNESSQPMVAKAITLATEESARAGSSFSYADKLARSATSSAGYAVGLALDGGAMTLRGNGANLPGSPGTVAVGGAAGIDRVGLNVVRTAPEMAAADVANRRLAGKDDVAGNAPVPDRNVRTSIALGDLQPSSVTAPGAPMPAAKKVESTFDATAITAVAATAPRGAAPATPAPASGPVFAGRAMTDAEGVALAKQQEGERLLAQSQLSPANTMRFRQSDSRARLRENKNSPPPPPVMTTFRFEQVGAGVRIIDEDGSVYTGQITGATPAKPAVELQAQAIRDEKAPKEKGADTDASRSKSAALESRQKAVAPEQNVLFRVQGTNRTTQQRVEFEGNLVLPMAPRAGQQLNFQAIPLPAQLQRGRIEGRAFIGRQQIEIRAIAAP